MKGVIAKIKTVINFPLKLTMANSYVKYLEESCIAMRGDIQNLLHEKAFLESKAQRLDLANERVARLTELVDTLRDRLHERGSTDAEREYLRVSREIYAAGKEMSKRRFDTHCRAIERQRELVGTGRAGGCSGASDEMGIKQR